MRLGLGLPAPAAGSRLCRTSQRRSRRRFRCSPTHWTRRHSRLFNLNSFKICALRLWCALTPRAHSPSYPLDFYTSTQNISFVKFSPPPHCIGFSCGGYRTALSCGLCFVRPCSALFTKGIFCEIECYAGLVAPVVAPSFGTVCATRRGLPALARSFLGRAPSSDTTTDDASRRPSFCPRSVYEQKINAPTLSTLILYKK